MFACLSVLFIAVNVGWERRRRVANWEDVVGDGCAHYLDSQEVLHLHFNYTTSRRGLSASLMCSYHPWGVWLTYLFSHY